ncbi:hypothetical protein [Serratia fonticola]
MKIIGITSHRSSKVQGMGDRYLQLESHPEPGWVNFFNDTYSNYFSTSKRRARIEGDQLVINCTLDEIQSQIIVMQEQLLRATNRFNQNEIQLKLESEAQEAALKEQEDIANNVFNNLKFR